MVAPGWMGGWVRLGRLLFGWRAGWLGEGVGVGDLVRRRQGCEDANDGTGWCRRVVAVAVRTAGGREIWQARARAIDCLLREERTGLGAGKQACVDRVAVWWCACCLLRACSLASVRYF